MSYGQFLHQAPYRGHGDCHSHGPHWHRCHAAPTHGPVPKHRPSRDSGESHLPGRGCCNRGAVRSHAHRATNERCGQHELHVLQQCQQWADYSHGQFRYQDRSKHRSDSVADAYEPGEFTAAHRRSELRGYGSEIHNGAPDAGQPVFAKGNLRQHLPGQLFLYQSERPANTSAGYRERDSVRSWPVRNALLGETRPACKNECHGSRDRQGNPDAEHSKPCRTDRW